MIACCLSPRKLIYLTSHLRTSQTNHRSGTMLATPTSRQTNAKTPASLSSWSKRSTRRLAHQWRMPLLGRHLLLGWQMLLPPRQSSTVTCRARFRTWSTRTQTYSSMHRTCKSNESGREWVVATPRPLAVQACLVMDQLPSHDTRSLPTTTNLAIHLRPHRSTNR